MEIFLSRSLYPARNKPGTHWTGGWVGLRAGVYVLVKKNISCPYRESNPGSRHFLRSLITYTRSNGKNLQYSSQHTYCEQHLNTNPRPDLLHVSKQTHRRNDNINNRCSTGHTLTFPNNRSGVQHEARDNDVKHKT